MGGFTTTALAQVTKNDARRNRQVAGDSWANWIAEAPPRAVTVVVERTRRAVVDDVLATLMGVVLVDKASAESLPGWSSANTA